MNLVNLHEFLIWFERSVMILVIIMCIIILKDLFIPNNKK